MPYSPIRLIPLFLIGLIATALSISAQGEFLVKFDNDCQNFSKVSTTPIPSVMYVTPGFNTYNETEGIYYFVGRPSQGIPVIHGIDATDGTSVFSLESSDLTAIEYSTHYQTLFAIRRNNQNDTKSFVSIDPISGVVTPLGMPLPSSGTFQGYDSFNDKDTVYTFTAPPNILYTIDAQSGNVIHSPTYNLTVGQAIQHYSYDNTTGRLYGQMTEGAGQTVFLVEIDVTNGDITKIGTGKNGLSSGGSSTIDEANGYYIFQGGDNIVKLDLVTGEIVLEGTIPLDQGDNIVDIEYDNVRKMLVAKHWDAEIMVSVDNANAVIEVLSASLCEGADLELMEVGANNVTWQWSGPDSFSSSDQNPVIPNITAAAYGTYTVTVTDIAGTTATASQEIIASMDSIIIDLPAQYVICQDGIVLQASVTSTTSYRVRWYKDGVFYPSPNTNTLFVDMPGMYAIQVENLEGCTTMVGTNVQAGDSEEIVLNDLEICQGEEAILEAVTTYTGDLTWSQDGNLLSETSTSLQVTQAGEYSVLYINECGDVIGTDALVSEGNGTPVSLAPTHLLCSGSINLEATTTATTVTWLYNGNVIPGQNSPLLNVDLTGNYTVQVSSAQNCLSESSTEVISATSISMSDLVFCDGGSGTLIAMTDSNGPFVWTFNGTSLAEVGSTLTVQEAGLYTVSFLDECGTTSTSATVTLVDGEQISLNATYEFCEGEIGVIEAITDASTITWLQNGIMIPGQTLTTLQITEAGTYTLVANIGTECESSASTTVTFSTGITSEEIYYLCEGGSVNVEGLDYMLPGLYTINLPASGDCGDILNFEIIELPSVVLNESYTVCEGELVNVGGMDFSMAGNYTLTYPEPIYGCDTILNLSITHLPVVRIEKSLLLVDGESATFNGVSYDSAGEYILTLPSPTGCDTVCILKVIEESCFVYYNFDACNSSLTGAANDYSEFIAEYPSAPSCGTIAASTFQRADPSVNGHSCTDGLEGTPAICISSEDTCTYPADSDKSGRIILAIRPEAGEELRLSRISFSQMAPELFQWSHSSGLNNYPTKFGVRIIMDGVEVYRVDELATTLSWSEVVLDLEDKVVVSTAADLEIQFLGYCLIGNGFAVSAFDLEDIKIYGGCSPEEVIPVDEICDNGIDDDQDGAIDCADSDLVNDCCCKDPLALSLPNFDLCDETALELVAQTNYTGAFVWYKDGVLLAETTARLSVTDSGIYRVAFTDECDNNIEASSVVTLRERVDIDMLATYSFCEGMRGTIQANTSASNLTWYINGFLLPGQNGTSISVSEPGTYTAVVADGTTCESSAATTVSFLPSTISMETYYFCTGEVVTVNGLEYSLAGTYSLSLGDEGDCSNILNFEIIELPSVTIQDDFFVCEGEPVFVNGLNYFADGNYSLSYPGTAGACDSIYNFSITYLPEIELEKYLQLADGIPVSYNGVTYDIPGQYVTTLPSQTTCDTTCIIYVTEESCLVNYTFDACNSSVTLGAHDYLEFTPEYPSVPSCGAIAATTFQRIDPFVNSHSCTDGLDGTSAICISSAEDCNYPADSDKSGRISISVSPDAGSELVLSRLTFSQMAPEIFQWSHTSGPNNYPTKFGVRIIMDGVEVYRLAEMATTLIWSEVELNFENELVIRSDANIEIQFLGYCLVGNGSSVSAFDLEDIKIYGGCRPINQQRLLAGRVALRGQRMMERVEITSFSNDIFSVTESDINGDYAFVNTAEEQSYYLTAKMDENHLAGVSTLDLIMIQRHILGLEPLTEPLDLIAADVNNSGRIDGVDLVELRKLILGIYSELPNNDSYRFFEKKSVLIGNSTSDLIEEIQVSETQEHLYNLDFIGVKIGDINSTAIQPRSSRPFNISISDRNFVVGEEVIVPVYASNFQELIGMQAELTFDAAMLEFGSVNPKTLKIKDSKIGVTNISEGTIALSWNDVEAVSLTAESALFEIVFTAKERGSLKGQLELVSSEMKSEAYNSELEILPLKLSYISSVAPSLELYQNMPNPFSEETEIRFNLPAKSAVTLTVYDLNGRKILIRTSNCEGGSQVLSLSSSELSVEGVMYYKLETAYGTATKKMIQIR